MAEATIRDVARLAEVSVASVSRALNGLDNVSDETRARVTAAATALGYVPHAGARSLSLSRTHAIGVVLPDLFGEFFSEMVRGMDREAQARGYMLLLSNIHADAGQAATALRAMRGRVDGLLVMAPHLSEEAILQALPQAIPAVLLNSSLSIAGRTSLRIDNGAGARAVAGHFIALGCKRIAHIRGPVGNIDAEERCEAFREVLAGRDGIAIEILHGDFSEESGEAAVVELIRSGRSFDAVFGGNDNMAIGALQALRDAGLRVPGDVAVAGFDDIPMARHLGLTTVRVQIAELGRRAVACLMPMLDGSAAEPGEGLQTPELIVRATTDNGKDES